MNMRCPVCAGCGQVFDVDCIRHDANLHELLHHARNNFRNMQDYAEWLQVRVAKHKQEINELRRALDEARSVRRDVPAGKKSKYDSWVLVG